MCTREPNRSSNSAGAQKHRAVAMSKVTGSMRMVAYLPSLRTILLRLRASSATPSSLAALTSSSLSQTTSYCPQSSPILPLLSHTSPQPPLSDALVNPALVSTQLHPQFLLPGAVGLAPTPPERQSPPCEDVPIVMSSVSDKPQGTVECLVQECPSFLLKGMLELFPGVKLKSEKLCVITMSEKTENDMTSWSASVEEEREQLLEHFIDSAKEICSRLTAAGYFADFIDPSSGRAFYSPYSHSTLFETDDRFQHLGFDIMDLGCCKCIRHPFWGPYIFMGTIFTDAPVTSQVVASIMEL